MKVTYILRLVLLSVQVLIPVVNPLQSRAARADGQKYVGVVALNGTPHLWLIDQSGTRHWAGDTRALAGKDVNWSARSAAATVDDVGATGDPLLSAGLLKDGDPIYLVKWESGWDKPVLQHIQSIEDVRAFGITGSNYGTFVIDRGEWERRFGMSAGSLQREELAPAAKSSPSVTTTQAPVNGPTMQPRSSSAQTPAVVFIQGFNTHIDSSLVDTVFGDVVSGFVSAGMQRGPDLVLYSYNGIDLQSRAIRGYSCADVGQPLETSLDRLEDYARVILARSPDRKMFLVGHSYGGFVAAQALVRASVDPSHAWFLDTIAGIITFDSPLYGSGLWRSKVAGLFFDLTNNDCMKEMIASQAADAIISAKQDSSKIHAKYIAMAKAASRRDIPIITVGNSSDLLYNPSKWGGVAALASLYGCIQSAGLACGALLGSAAFLEDNSRTQIIDLEGVQWRLDDLGTSPDYGHTATLHNAEVRRWAFGRTRLATAGGQTVSQPPAPNSQPAQQVVQPAVVPARPTPAPIATPVSVSVSRPATFSNSVRLTPNGVTSKYGVTLNLYAGDVFGVSFAEQLNGDIRLYVLASDGSLIYSAGQVRGPFSTGGIQAPANGQYVVWFDNGFSLVSGKTISLRIDYPQH